ncbi:MAG: DNA-directed RNA polymerase subunit omega [Clostridiaceae bacterium]|nr:DNA-directed RNA polymerase subunit omega [Clostridiaceae bacterium]
MLTKPTVEELLPKAENRYILSMLTAKRARQLVDGAQPLIDSKTENMVSLAAEEINEDQVKPIKGNVEVTVPLRPEVEAERLTAELEAEAKRRENKQQTDSSRFNERLAARETNTYENQRSVGNNEFNRMVTEQLLNTLSEKNFFNNDEEDDDDQ